MYSSKINILNFKPTPFPKHQLRLYLVNYPRLHILASNNKFMHYIYIQTLKYIRKNAFIFIPILVLAIK